MFHGRKLKQKIAMFDKVKNDEQIEIFKNLIFYFSLIDWE